MQKIIFGHWFLLRKALSALAVFTAIISLFACSHEEEKPYAQAPLKLSKVSFSALDGWNNDDFSQIIPVFAKNCAKIMQNNRTYLSDSAVKVKTSDYQKVCKNFSEKNISTSEKMKKFLEAEFVPYRKRAEIENNGVDAPVLMWADDPVDIHFMQIQGSAIAKMDDGSELRIGYADNHGHKYKGIGSIMLEKKILKAGEVSMENIRKWLKTHPTEAKKLMQENDRFIFQRLSDSDGPLGALGVPLTAGRSMAIDNSLLPLGTVFWLDTVSPDRVPLKKVMFAQDIGAAIKGAVRGDYFWGHGDEALHHAGRMNSAGKYYLLLPKNSTPKVE